MSNAKEFHARLHALYAEFPTEAQAYEAEYNMVRSQLENRTAELVAAQASWRKECDDADTVLRYWGFKPERFRTECGFLNLPKIRAAIQHPEFYPPRATDNGTEGHMEKRNAD